MLFCTQKFLLFFAVVLVAYWALPWHRARIGLLLAASLYFYASWSQRLAAVVAATTTVDYFLARGLDASRSRRGRTWLLVLSLLMNLGLLFYFKYANFFLESLEAALHAGGSSASIPLLRIVLPIGISFYTFEAISYTVDVYRRRIPAEKNLAHFMLFITFFPHLVAGPIVRARDFLPQVRRRKRLSWARWHLGGQLILMGMFKKMAIADHMALFADPVFADQGQYSTAALWVATLAYALQIYCDFSGYSDLALGTAHLLGYKLARNFDMPYFSPNMTELWKRWHISLSTWLRDYVFIPLGGSRGSRLRTHGNLLVAMTLCGLWHGATWTCVVWGAWQGLLLIVHRWFQEFCKPRPGFRRLLETPSGTVVRIVVTFLGFCSGLVIFRNPTLSAGTNMLWRLVVPSSGHGYAVATGYVLDAALIVLVCHLLAQRGLWQKLLDRVPAPARGLGYAAALVLTVLLAPVTTQTFIYFQF